MNTKCTTCGAPQTINEDQTCIYCGDLLKNEDLKEDFLKDFIPVKYEFSQGNYDKVIKLADKYLEKDLFNVPCWSFKIISEFFFKSESMECYDFSILQNSLKSIIDLNITSILSQKVIEQQIMAIPEIITKRNFYNSSFKYFEDFKIFLQENFSLNFSIECIAKLDLLYIQHEQEVDFYQIGDRDVLFEDAAKLIVSAQQGSIALIQRRMKLGYNRAGYLLDQLEAAGIVGPSKGNEPRDVMFKTVTELYNFLQNL